jgi:hypothetical protein
MAGRLSFTKELRILFKLPFLATRLHCGQLVTAEALENFDIFQKFQTDHDGPL